MERHVKQRTGSSWAWILGSALIVMVLNVAAHVAYMVLYGHVLNPGHPVSHYTDHANRSAPYSSMIVGFALMFLAGRFVGKRAAEDRILRSAVGVAVVYTVIDVAILVAVGVSAEMALLATISAICKFAGAYLGGRSALGQRASTVSGTSR